MKTLRKLAIVVAVVFFIAYGLFRIKRAKGDIQRSRAMAKALLDVERQYDRGRSAVDLIGRLSGVGEVSGVAETIADLLQDGQVSRLKNAMADARHCDAEVNRQHGPVDLLLFEQPTPCRSMFRTIGEAGSLTDVGYTFGDAALKVVNTTPPGAPGGPACQQWEITAINFKVPKRKKNRKSWDVMNGKPDPFVEIKLGLNSTTTSGVMMDRRTFSWTPRTPIRTTPNREFQIRAYDKDQLEHDFIYGHKIKVPTNIDGSTWKVGKFSLTVNCAQ